jgi:ATPase subunit of ABC transporter with duplicated ATPase domains
LSLVDLEKNARSILIGLGFKEATMKQPLGTLSGGWQMRCMLASVLIQEVDIMILDEPTNFLDLLGIIWLQNYLINLRTESPRIVLLVSHDRDFLDNVCEEIVFLKDQSLSYFRGNLSTYEDDLKSRQINLTKMKDAQERQTAHMEKTISTNIKAGKKSGDDNKLRQAVSRRKRIDDRMGMQVNAKGGRFKLNRDLGGLSVLYTQVLLQLTLSRLSLLSTCRN